MKISANTYLTVNGIKFTIKPKNGKWHIAFKAAGKRKHRTTNLISSKQNLLEVKNEVIPQVAQELLDMVRNKTSNNVTTNDDVILEAFADKHFDIHKNNVRPHVFKRDYSNYLNHILQYFKGRNLKSLKPMELEAWQNRLLSKYKFSSVQKYRSILYSILTRAVQNDIIIILYELMHSLYFSKISP